MKSLTGLAVSTLVFAAPAVAKECRMPDLPQGVQVQVPPECRDLVRVKQQTEGVKSNQGMIDLGNGTQIRIGGRARAEMKARP